MEIDINAIGGMFGYEIQGYEKIRSMYKCKTNAGVKNIRETQLSREKLIYQYRIKEHLYKNNFKNIDNMDINILTMEPFVCKDGKCYIMTRWIEGRECDLENSNDLKMAILTLAKLHIASKNFEIVEENNPKDDLGKLQQIYEKRKTELVRLKKKVTKETVLNEFDKLFRDSVDRFIQNAQIAINFLKTSNYDKLVKKTKEEKSFCHHDYAFHNIIIENDGKVNVTDFDYAMPEIRIYDFANVVKRHMRKCSWNIDEMKMMVDTYNKIDRLTIDELEVLYAMLIFPQKYWRIVNRFYNGKKLWTCNTESQRLSCEIDEEDEHERFIREYSEVILNV